MDEREYGQPWDDENLEAHTRETLRFQAEHAPEIAEAWATDARRLRYVWETHTDQEQPFADWRAELV